MNLFKTKPRTPSEFVRALRDAVPKLDSGSLDNEACRKANEELEVVKYLQTIKTFIYGDVETEPIPQRITQLAQEAYATDLLPLLIHHIGRFDFESRKDVVQICNGLVRRQVGTRWPTVEYICAGREEIVLAALAGYAYEATAINTGMILREMLRHEPLAEILIHSEQFYMFPRYIETASFGVSCDAFGNFKELLTRHKSMVADFVDEHYDRFFASLMPLVLSQSHVTQRQSIKLLGEILLDRAHFNVMTRYIAQEENLKTVMNLLRSKSKNVQFEAFHVFKIFVANPKKPPEIEVILRRNQEKLLKFFENFQNDKADDQFTDEKQFLIEQIQNL